MDKWMETYIQEMKKDLKEAIHSIDAKVNSLDTKVDKILATERKAAGAIVAVSAILSVIFQIGIAYFETRK